MKNYYIACMVCLLHLPWVLYAQVPGCTDSLALNYNASANQNDGSCLYAASSIAPISSSLLADSLAETSGLIEWNQRLWTHNDNTDTHIYALDTSTAAIIQMVGLAGVANIDWEDIAQDSDYIYVGDFGNNVNGNRTDLRILRIEKSTIFGSTVHIDTINFAYENQTDFSPTGPNNTDFDCESFVVAGDSIYLFTKQWVSKKTSIYALSKLPGSHIALLKSTYDVQGLITGACYIASLRLVNLCGYSNLLQPFSLLLYDFQGNEFFSANKRKVSISLPFHQIEGIAGWNGSKYYMSNERFTAGSSTVEQQLHVFDFSTYLSHYLANPMLSIDSKEASLYQIYPNPSNDELLITNLFQRTPYVLFDHSGQEIEHGYFSPSITSLNIRELPTGRYTLKLAASSYFPFIKY